MSKLITIGNIWLRSKDNARAGSLKLVPGFPATVKLAPGRVLFVTPNKKRPNRNDPDLQVSIEVDDAVATELKAKIQANQRAYSAQSEKPSTTEI